MVFDLDKLIAERGKTRKKRFAFTFDGKPFSLSAEPDIIAARAASIGDNLTAFRRLLGPDQWVQIVGSPTLLLPADLIAIMSAYYDEVYGQTPGESSASSPSSKNTARPSKRTSTGTTRRNRSTR